MYMHVLTTTLTHTCMYTHMRTHKHIMHWYTPAHTTKKETKVHFQTCWATICATFFCRFFPHFARSHQITLTEPHGKWDIARHKMKTIRIIYFNILLDTKRNLFSPMNVILLPSSCTTTSNNWTLHLSVPTDRQRLSLLSLRMKCWLSSVIYPY